MRMVPLYAAARYPSFELVHITKKDTTAIKIHVWQIRPVYLLLELLDIAQWRTRVHESSVQV